MRTAFSVFLLCGLVITSWGQQSVQLFPTLGNRHIAEQGLIETGNSIFIPYRVFRSTARPNSNGSFISSTYNIYKFDKATATFKDSVQLGGDTGNTGPLYLPRYAASCYDNGKMYFLSNKLMSQSGISGGDSNRFYLSVVDTNLNILFADRLVTEAKSALGSRLIRSMIFYQDRLLVNCRTTVRDGVTYKGYPNLLVIDISGTVVQDAFAGTFPLPQAGGCEVSGLIKDLDADTNLYIGGTFLSSNSVTSLYRTNTNLNVLADYGHLSPYPAIVVGPPTSNYQDFHSPSFSDVIDGQLFVAGEYLEDVPACNNGLIPIQATSISKHRRADTFRRSQVLTFPNSSCANVSVNQQLSHKVLYSKAANCLYYVNYNSLGSGCDTAENNIQIICVDTNLNLKWRKQVTPKKGTCSQTLQALLPEVGTGLTIAGNYFDNSDPTDSTRSGTFLLRLDSAGLLSTSSNPRFAVRDRFNVYPNPAKEGFWVEDIAGVPAKAFLYDLAGRQVGTYNLTGRKNFIALPACKTGMLLLRVVPQWGEGWSQMVQVVE